MVATRCELPWEGELDKHMHPAILRFTVHSSSADRQVAIFSSVAHFARPCCMECGSVGLLLAVAEGLSVDRLQAKDKARSIPSVGGLTCMTVIDALWWVCSFGQVALDKGPSVLH